MTIEDMDTLTKYEQPVKKTHKMFYVCVVRYEYDPINWHGLMSSHSREEIEDHLTKWPAGIQRARIYPVNLPIGDQE